MLGNHSNDFRVPQKNLAHFSGGRLAVLQRERDRHGSANPEIAFFQMRKEFASQPQAQKCGHCQKGDADPDCKRTAVERKAQRGIVDTMQQRGRLSFRLPSRAQGRSNEASTGVIVNVAIKAPASA